MTGFTMWRDPPPGVRRDQVTLEPHAVHVCAGPDWRDCVLVVEDGGVVLRTDGGELGLPQGAVFCLTEFAAPVLHNPGPGRATITRAARVHTGTHTDEKGNVMIENQSPADEYAEIAGRFTELVEGVPDGETWARRSPVAEWTARDVVRHLVEWFPAFLAGGAGITLPQGPDVDDDPVAAWRTMSDGVQAVLVDPSSQTTLLVNRHIGEVPVPQAISQFFTGDVFMHTWDLARATGQDERLDPRRCALLLEGLQPLDDVLRSSGQYGPKVDVPDDADVQTRLIAFIGRDPR